jgi:hypothetical protein
MPSPAAAAGSTQCWRQCVEKKTSSATNKMAKIPIYWQK